MIKISNFLLLSLVILVVFIPQLGMHGDLSPLFTGVGLIIFVIINSFLFILNKIDIFNKKLIIQIPHIPISIYFLFIALFIFSLCSYFVTERFKGVIVYSALILLFFTVRIQSTTIVDKDKFIINLIFGACITGILIMILGLNKPFTQFRYEGYYVNSNSMGMFTASLIHMIVAILYIYKNSINRLKKFFFYSIFLISILFLLASNSRAAIFSVFIVLLLVPIVEGYKGVKFFKLKIKTKSLKNFFSYLFIICLFFTFIYLTGLLDNTSDKFISKQNAGDFSAGRFQGWIVMIENWSWFGHKNFQDITDQKIIFGHNTWLSHLNYNGILATFCFLGWIYFILKWSWAQIKLAKNTGGAVILLFTLVGYIINATFETATSTPGILMSVVLFAILYRKDDIFLSKS
jgi:hypothetical protein